MIVLDSTILVDLLRDRSGGVRKRLEARLDGETIAITRPAQYEVLRGCKDQRNWDRVARHLASHHCLETGEATWERAARIYFDLKKKGKIVRSGIDCVIAQIVIEQERLLLHNDADFELIATVRPLKHERVDFKNTAVPSKSRKP